MTATILAIIAIVLSGLSLSWQALSWWWEGQPRITGSVETEFEKPAWEVKINEDRSAKVIVTVINIGRAPATVTNPPRVEAMELRGDRLLNHVPMTFQLTGDNPRTPNRLDVGATLQWCYSITLQHKWLKPPDAMYKLTATVNTPRSRIQLTGSIYATELPGQ